MLLYRLIEYLNGETKGSKRQFLSYAQWQALKVLILIHLIR